MDEAERAIWGLLQPGPMKNYIWDEEAQKVLDKLETAPVVLAGLPKTGTTSLFISLEGKARVLNIDTGFECYREGDEAEQKLVLDRALIDVAKYAGLALGQRTPIRALGESEYLVEIDEATGLGDFALAYLNSESTHNRRIVARLHKSRKLQEQLGLLSNFQVHYMPSMTREQMEAMIHINMQAHNSKLTFTDEALEMVFRSTCHPYEQCILGALAVFEGVDGSRVTAESVEAALQRVDEAMFYQGGRSEDRDFLRYNIASKMRDVVCTYPARLTLSENMFLLGCIDGEHAGDGAEQPEIADELERCHLVEKEDEVYAVPSALVRALYRSGYKKFIENGTFKPPWLGYL